ncbi:MAG: class I SAM-dependent methyltransferase [Candidatus Sericytochromatia bacterium]
MSWLYKKNLENIYNPFNAWLHLSNEDEIINNYFKENIDKFNLKNGKKKILDVGCSSGKKSLFFIDDLNKNSIDFTYYALEPFQEQLDIFKDKAKHLKNIIYLNSELETFNTKEKFDFIIICHSLYYVKNIKFTLKKLLDLGKEILIFHQGSKGVNIIHEKFNQYLKKRPNINLNDLEIFDILKNDFNKNVYIEKLIGHIDVSECSDINSRLGQALISFF